MSDILYIIGNGFDLHHGIPSAYSAFGRYLAERDRATAEFVARYFYVNSDFWSEFEERLASFDSDKLVEDAAQFLVPYSADDWSDAYHHDYQYEIGRVVSALTETMRARFAEWVRQLPIPNPAAIGAVRLSIDATATFLNFNYTSSLQRLYAVPDAQILHIHGSAAGCSPRSRPWMGTGESGSLQV
jgi:Bacteriophage abortive infection AbiH